MEDHPLRSMLCNVDTIGGIKNYMPMVDAFTLMIICIPLQLCSYLQSLTHRCIIVEIVRESEDVGFI